MDRTEIFEKIVEIASDVLGAEADEISEDTSFDDFDANSLERLQLVTAFEDEFDIEIPDEKLESLTSVSDALDVIESIKED